MDERQLVAFFEDLHAHPELGFEEYRTTEKVVAELERCGIERLETGLRTGAIAVVGGKRPGRTIGLRCDMDALPIQEATNLSYVSQNDGVMHACGHDFHTAVMLGAAALLKAREAEIPGMIKIVFQPAEEIAVGGKAVVATGLLDDVAEFYGIHSYPRFERGVLGIKEGPVMAAPDRFRIDISGRGTHAAQPYKGVNPIPAAAAVVSAAQSLTGLAVDPFSPALVTVTHIEAGNTWNVVPGAAVVEGTVRTLIPRDRERIRAGLERIARSSAEAYGCDAAFTWGEGPAAVINDGALCAVARELALEMGFRVDRQEDTLGGEDFSEYLRRCPGVFIRVGTGGGYPSHHPKFTVDTAALWPAARYFARLAFERAGA